MRLFIAIPMTETVGEQLNKLQRPIKGVRWEQENKFHLTLKFLGDTEPQKIQELQDALEEMSMPSFSIILQGFGYFPRGGSPRVLWAGINKHRPLEKLQRTIEDLCTNLGFEPEQRSFKPHVTVARIKDAPKEEITSFIAQHENFRQEEIPVNKVVLFESKLHSDGAEHIPQKEIKLA